ncbi:hypothetical protein K443DRAFT_490374 [Laccaria amethystina LaAM-08-1]|uniref:Uncharacterized protein n=1 Tax=Laccaria amethystina LaAM-08-1 TaxID=1095629 RepID=A0A0C9WHJ9_9AGAR|nr:hypothetical protein K443DRAFT_490374 [Laccaria amethystina LaAM-08-1]
MHSGYPNTPSSGLQVVHLIVPPSYMHFITARLGMGSNGFYSTFAFYPFHAGFRSPSMASPRVVALQRAGPRWLEVAGRCRYMQIIHLFSQTVSD